jgi:hypothetical protein
LPTSRTINSTTSYVVLGRGQRLGGRGERVGPRHGVARPGLRRAARAFEHRRDGVLVGRGGGHHYVGLILR